MQEEDLSSPDGAAGFISLDESQSAIVPARQLAVGPRQDDSALLLSFQLWGEANYLADTGEHLLAILRYSNLLKLVDSAGSILPCSPVAEILCQRARSWLQLDVLPNAISDLDRAEELAGEIAVHNLGLYAKANELQDRVRKAHFYAVLYWALGNEKRKAEKILDRVRTRVKEQFCLSQNDAIIIQTLQRLMGAGITYFEDEKIEVAVEFFKEVATLFPYFPDAYVYRAKCYMKLEEIDNANKSCNRALEYSNRMSSTAFALKVEILSRKGKLDEALEHVKQWQEIDPENSELQTKLEELSSRILERDCNVALGKKIQPKQKATNKSKKTSGSFQGQPCKKPKSNKMLKREERQRQQEVNKIAKELEENRKEADEEKRREGQEKKGQDLHESYPECDITAGLIDDPNFEDSPRAQASREKRGTKTRRKTRNVRKSKAKSELLPVPSASEMRSSDKKEPIPPMPSRVEKRCKDSTGKHGPVKRSARGARDHECRRTKKTSQKQQERNEGKSMRKPEKKSQRTDYTRDKLVRSLEGVRVTCEPAVHDVTLVVPEDDVNNPQTYRWTIRLQYDSNHVGHLQEVTLSHQYHKTYSITDILLQVPGVRRAHIEDLNQSQYSFPLDLQISGECTVEVSVVFFSRDSGCFPQCLVLNFGRKYHLSVELNVDVGTESFVQEVKKVKKIISFAGSLWDDSSKRVVKFEPRPPNTTEETDRLLTEFKLPTRPEVIVPSPLMTGDAQLNPDNYRRVMHQILLVEEYSMRQQISRFNVQNTKLTVTNQHGNINRGTKWAQGGELFGHFKVPFPIWPDDAAGRLLLRTEGSVLLAFNEATNESTEDTKDVVYESLIVEMEDDCVTVRLSAKCCQELSLCAECDVKVEAQFQINRIPLCEMHDNIDKLRPEHKRILFPALSNCSTPQPVSLRWTPDSHLNEKQRHVIQAIAAPLFKLSPPLTVFGPFGTGKTYTLNQAVHQVVLDRNNRVLICTHSNSAADIHVEHLDHYLKQEKGLRACKPLRIYSVMRQLSTVSDTVKEYCLIKDGSFRPPTRDDVMGHRVVVTTLTASRVLFDKELHRGFFSHIFIDEAAQALETETLAPLILAGYRTKVVFAGDHMQMNPDVFSEEAIKWGFQKSLHERLSHVYNRSDQASFKSNLMHLTENYRSHKDILQFPSDMFYGGELISRADQPLHPELGPLVFYSAIGREEMEGAQGSYRNLAEVDEIVRRVKKLVEEWPAVWGPVAPASIGVVTPYHYQVKTIRDRLRKMNLSDITVERIQNVQGKEFRALFISTVRTAHTCREAVKRMQKSVSQDHRVYFEFLTDHKLLNTAFTRAKSLVAVVGDPYSLRTMGECQRLWGKLIERCSAKGKLFGVTLEDLQKQIATSGLDVNSPEFTPVGISRSGSNEDSRGVVLMHKENSLSGEHPAKGTVEAGLAVETMHLDSADGTQREAARSIALSEQEKESSPNAAEDQTDSSDEESVDGNSSENDEDDDRETDLIEIDDIIRAFSKDCIETRRRDEENDSSFQSPGASGRPALPIYEETITDDIEMVSINGRTVARLVNLGYTRGTTERTKRLLHQHDSPPKESLDPEFLTRLLRENPHKYLKGRLRLTLERYRQIYGEVQDTETEDILIKGQPRQVLEQDTVVIELNKEHMRPTEQASIRESSASSVTESTRHESGSEQVATIRKEGQKKTGNIVGILHNMIEPRGRSYVCTIHRENPDLMIPINKSMSVIAVWKRTANWGKGVEIYRKIKAEEVSDLECIRTVPYKKAFSGEHLFVVQYLHWRRDFPLPLGIVTKWLPQGNNLAHALEILYTEYGVQKKFPENVVRELQGTSKSVDIPGKEREKRLRVDGAFTIDPLGSEDLDDALTVQETADGDLKVGIHIADVSFYVKEGSELDKEAKQRCTSHYPGNDMENIPMLPRELSEGLCSLLPGRDRLTMSIFLNFNSSGEVQGKPEFRRTITHSSCRLTYSKAQKIIFQENIESTPEPVVDSIRTLHKLAETRRKTRLGDAALNPSEDQDGDSEAHQLVEEMMVLANQTVATFLKEKSPKSALLRTQLPPKSHRLREWKKKYGTFAKYSFSLKKHIAEEDNKSSPEEKFAILSSTWSNMVDAARRQDHRKLCHLICDDRIHPQVSVALTNFFRIQAKAEYFCTGEPESDQQGAHFSMQSEYTHFTSPIRRYFDIMVHRQLLSLCNAETVGQDDDTQELATACRRCTFLSENANKFEKECKRVYIADKLKKGSGETMAFIGALEKGVIELQVASRKEDHLPGKEKKIQVSHLGPIKQPENDEIARETRLEWRLRIYLASHPAAGDDNMSQDGVQIRKILGLHQQRNNLVREIAGDVWMNILSLVKSGNSEGLRDIILKVDGEAIEKSGQPLAEPRASRPGHVASSEDKEDEKHFYTKSLRLRTGDVVKVQLASRLSRGLLTPDIQLFKLTPQLSICLEHRRYANHCFAKRITEEASKEKYKSLDHYINAWEPVLAVEAARQAVQADDVFTILGMKLNWNQESEESVTAMFELSPSYCKLRHIKFGFGDLVCVRASYHVENDRPLESYDADKPHDSELNQRNEKAPSTSKNRRLASGREKRCWVGHCTIVDVTEPNTEMADKTKTEMVDKTKTKMWRVHMKLNQQSYDMPAEIVGGAVDGWDCEFIRLSIPHRQMYGTLVSRLKKTEPTSLVQKICLGKPIRSSDSSLIRLPSDELSISVTSPNSRFEPLNRYQDAAVRTALTLPFTLIQGPPGTGKTVTGVHIAAWFAEMNRQKDGVSGYSSDELAAEKVLYCGPSNKSVDVVAEYLLKVPDVKILRIYGTLLEREEFPIPNTLKTGRRTRTKEELKVPESLKPVSLHHVIRHKTSPYARELAMYEKQFKNPKLPRNQLDSIIAKYRKVITEAEVWAVKGRGVQIVLCTCTASGSPRVVKLCDDIAQCIVDECGMSMEPETLIPITCSRAKQIVLIGDHKQLQAIVKDDQAKMFGLDKSLFERYAKKALMLKLQYRMHPAICDFPSTQFYEGKLQTDDSVIKRAPSRVEFWPAVDPEGQPVPLVFCHVQGTEDELVVTTEEGSERSKSNKEEQRQTVRLAKMLIKDYKVKPDDVVVLSPYRAQCHNIREELHQSGYKIPVMSVVKSQGSEWDHVILSLVRSLPEEEIEYQPSTRWLEENLGFLTDEHQINVALTRARKGLCIIGNKNLLRVHEMWNNLITDYEIKKCCVDGNTWLPA